MNVHENYSKLIKNISPLGSAIVAFSGGVDSALLLKVTSEALSSSNVIAVTARSAAYPDREFRESVDFCTDIGIRHIFFDSDELEIEGFDQNPKNRCYLCKKHLFSKILEIAREYDIDHVLEGSNKDDEGDYRPGMQAIAELGIKSPLRECGLTKGDIRELSRELGLNTAEKPSFACLYSRFVYGEKLTKKRVVMVDDAEKILADAGFKQYRVRVHGDGDNVIARIEVLPEDITRLADEKVRTLIYSKIKTLGFGYVTMDLLGYRTGSMNETILTQS